MKIVGILHDVKEDEKAVILTLSELKRILTIILDSSKNDSDKETEIMDILKGMSERRPFWNIDNCPKLSKLLEKEIAAAEGAL